MYVRVPHFLGRAVHRDSSLELWLGRPLFLGPSQPAISSVLTSLATQGWNWRAVVTTILSLLPCLPGFAQQIASGPLPGLSKIGTNLFYVSFVLTYTLAITLYLSLSYLFPRKYIAEHDLKSQRFEQLADEGDAREREDEILALGEDGSLGAGAAMDKTESKSEVEGIAYVEPARVELR